MVQVTGKRLTLTEFLALPEGDVIYEFVHGQAVPKFPTDEMSPKFFHRSITGALFTLLSQWAEPRGRVRIEWAISLERSHEPWVPVPDLTYVSYDRPNALPKTYRGDMAIENITLPGLSLTAQQIFQQAGLSS